ncbi:MAG: arabinan endo-1,5-alpha-L-arabinosidase, partial [Burkholderiales bacterium]|nr:arabinan endo-1,5-alpha-L-arabinosidase [Anaerolineae bacterium]
MTISRRHLLKIGLAAAASASSSVRLPVFAAQTTDDINDAMSGAYQAVHDPAIIREGDIYYLFCTGTGITLRTSPDLIEWTLHGDVFPGVPEWALADIPAATNIWAPDISYFNDLYHLYYSVSTFGSNRSRIGLATTPTLDLDSPDHAWTDHGLVIASERSDDWNAIDPNLATDSDGNHWLAWGSFWGGIKMRRIDSQTGLLSTEDTELFSLASRPEAPRAIEAPVIISRDDYYYLFVSFDRCCAGT